jgi:polar amino acid transport system substrate-binding protein
MLLRLVRGSCSRLYRYESRAIGSPAVRRRVSPSTMSTRRAHGRAAPPTLEASRVGRSSFGSFCGDYGERGNATNMRKMTRRDGLRQAARYGAALAVGGGFLAACTPAAPSGTSATQAQATPVRPETRWDVIRREKTIQVGYAEEPPYGFLNPQGQLTGKDPEILRAIMAQYGVTTLVPVRVEFAGLVAGVQAGRFDVMAGHTTMTAERCANVAFATPNSMNLHAMAVAKGNPLKLTSFEDAVNNPNVRVAIQRGAVVRGWWVNDFKLPESRIVELPDIPGMVAALAAGRAEVAAAGAITLRRAVGQQADKVEVAEPFKHPLAPNGKPRATFASSAFRKTDTDLITAYNDGLKKLGTAELKRILNQFDFRMTDEDMQVLTSTTTEQACA